MGAQVEAYNDSWEKILSYFGSGKRLEHTRHEMEELFKAFDTDGGGTLDTDELRRGLMSFDIYLTKQQVKKKKQWNNSRAFFFCLPTRSLIHS